MFFLFCIFGVAYSWTLLPYDPKANDAAIVQTNTARFTVLTENVIRMEYSASGKFENRATAAVVNRKLPVKQFSKSIKNNVVTIETAYLTLTYQDGQPFSAKTLSIHGKVDATEFHYTPSGDIDKDNQAARNLYGTVRSLDEIRSKLSLDCLEIRNMSIHAESMHCAWSVFSRDGYAIIDDTKTAVVENDWLSHTPNVDDQDYYFFGHGLKYTQALMEFVSIFGKQPLVPRYSLGIMYCRWYDFSDLSIKKAVEEYQSRNMPLDVVVLDMNWHIYGPWGAYTWNTDLYPYPNYTQNWFTAQGLKTAANIHDADGISPDEWKYDEACKAMGLDPSKKQKIQFNVTSKLYMMTMEDIILKSLEQPIPSSSFSGFDFWWIDWQQGGKTGVYYSTINPTIWLNYVRSMDHIRRNENERGMVLARYGGYGNNRYSIGFSGDISHTWEMLQYEVYFTATASNVAYGYVSHDIMGAAGDLELNTRWIQWGAYSPIFRTHDMGEGTGGCADSPKGCSLVDIWTHPTKYFDIEHKALIERSEKLPMWYSLSKVAFDTGVSPIRPMYYAFPSLDDAYKYPQQYMIGDDMIVAPVAVSSGGKFNLSDWTIWIPPGTWYDRSLGKLIHGPTVIKMGFDLSEIPIYYRGGAIIPHLPFEMGNVLGRASKNFNSLRFDIYYSAAQPNGMTKVYEDDGHTYNYLRRESVETTAKYSASGSSLTVSVSSMGSYVGFPAIRPYQVKVFNVLPPKSVTCNKEVMPYIPVYDGAESYGWYYDGFVLAVVAICPAVSTGNPLEVDMEFAHDLNTYETVINGARGKFNRAVLSKQNLDEANVNFDSRKNLTALAGYGLGLSDVGKDANAVMMRLNKVDGYLNQGIAEIAQLIKTSNINRGRLEYSLNLVMGAK